VLVCEAEDNLLGTDTPVGGDEVVLLGRIDNPNAVLVAGHSHTWAYHAAWHQGMQGAPKSIVMVLQKGPAKTRKHLETIAAQSIGRVAVLVWQGNQHNRFIFSPTPEFEVMPSSRFSLSCCRPDPQERAVPQQGRFERNGMARLVPYTAAVSHFLSTLDGLREIILMMSGARLIVVAGTPPPKSETELRRGLAKSPQYVPQLDKIGATAETVRLTAFGTRLALWQALQDAMAMVARENNITFFPVPPEVQDADGALLDEFCHTDATHANAVLGAHMWRALASHSQLVAGGIAATP
jgi:hypothetical protein